MRLILAALLLLTSYGARAETDYRAINEVAVREHIQPRFAKLNEAARRFVATAGAGCGDLALLRRAWTETMHAWQAAQHLRFGPALLQNRHQRFAFWPDPRNSVPRQLADLFQSGQLPGFATGSVAVQGLTALERVLFDAGEAAKLTSEPFRCTWAKAVAENLAGMAKAMQAEWRDGSAYPKEFIAAKGDLVPYKESKEATLDLFKALHQAVELVADHKLARPLGKTAKDQRPQMAELWRSRQSGPAIAIDIEAARDLFKVFAPRLDNRALAADLTKRLDDLAVRTRDLDLDAALADASKRPMLEKLRADAATLKSLFAEKLAPALDIPVGFNALDGD